MINRNMTDRFTHLDAIFKIGGVNYVAVLEGSRMHRIAALNGILINSYQNKIKMQTELVYKLVEKN